MTRHRQRSRRQELVRMPTGMTEEETAALSAAKPPWAVRLG